MGFRLPRRARRQASDLTRRKAIEAGERGAGACGLPGRPAPATSSAGAMLSRSRGRLCGCWCSGQRSAGSCRRLATPRACPDRWATHAPQHLARMRRRAERPAVVVPALQGAWPGLERHRLQVGPRPLEARASRGGALPCVLFFFYAVGGDGEAEPRAGDEDTIVLLVVEKIL